MSQIDVFSIGDAVEQVRKALESGEYGVAREIGKTIIENEAYFGDAVDYHNLAVVFTKADDYLTGFQIIQKGLKQYPFEIDLLADGIYYGSSCGMYGECEEIVSVLLSRPYSVWNWRAFTFLTDYYLEKAGWTEDCTLIPEYYNSALDVALKFKECIPNDERGYSEEFKVRLDIAKIKTASGDTEGAERELKEAESVLDAVINQNQMTATMCCLRYADYLFEHRRYKEVMKCCERALVFGETQPSANLSYLMYLNALSKDVLIHEMNAYDDESAIKDVYNDYTAAIASSRGRSSYYDNIYTRCMILQSKSNVPVPDVIMYSGVLAGKALFADSDD